MQRSTIILLSAGVAVAGLGAIPFLMPLDIYRGPIERVASATMGREVHIRGPLHLALYPELGISLSDVAIANEKGAHHPEMITVGSVLVGAKLMPLFSRRLEVTEVVLQSPVIHLEVDKSGTANWQFGDAAASKPAPRGSSAARAPSAGAGANDGSAIAVRNVRISDGELTYYDAGSGSLQAVHNIAVTLNMPAAGTQARNQPLSIDGGLTYNSEPLKVNGKIDNFTAILKSQPTGAHISISSNIINSDFVGTLGTEGNFAGALKLGAHSIRSFAAWLGHPMPPGNGFGLTALEGQFSVQDGVYKLSHTHLAFDSMNMDVTVTIDTNPDVFFIKGGAQIDRLDIRPYLAPGTSEDTVKAIKAKADHPDAPLALDWLRAANADLTLVVGGLSIPDFKLDHAALKVALNKGVLKTDMSSVAAYGGTGKGALTVDAAAETPTFRQTLDLSGFKVQPLLDDLMGVREITGTGSLHVDVSSRAKSEGEFVERLNGNGEIRFNDGYISGVDLVAVSRILQSVLRADALKGAVGDNAKTPFGGMGASFVVEDGVLHTDDLNLESPAVEIDGTGNVDFPAKEINFRFNPEAKKNMPGLKLVDVGVPFYVKGPWKHPKYGPDTGSLAKTVVKKLSKDAKLPLDLLKHPGKTLKSLLGK